MEFLATIEHKSRASQRLLQRFMINTFPLRQEKWKQWLEDAVAEDATPVALSLDHIRLQETSPKPQGSAANDNAHLYTGLAASVPTALSASRPLPASPQSKADSKSQKHTQQKRTQRVAPLPIDPSGTGRKPGAVSPVPPGLSLAQRQSENTSRRTFLVATGTGLMMLAAWAGLQLVNGSPEKPLPRSRGLRQSPVKVTVEPITPVTKTLP